MSSQQQLFQAVRLNTSTAYSRSNSFTNVNTSRFYSDNSLDTRNRSLLSKQRQKKKMMAKRHAQEEKVAHLEEEYLVNTERLQAQQKRQYDRLVRRQQHNAAHRIQRLWHHYQRTCWIQYEENCAAEMIQNFVAECAIKNKLHRNTCAFHIQTAWAAYLDWQMLNGAAAFLQYNVRQFIKRLRKLRHAKACIIQQHVKTRIARRHDIASRILQGFFLLVNSRLKLIRMEKVVLYLFHEKLLFEAACKIQRVFGIVTTLRHLERYLSTEQMDFELEVAEDEKVTFQFPAIPRIRSAQLKRVLLKDTKLLDEETQLLEEIETITKRISLARYHLEEEKNKLKRAHVLEKQKDIDLQVQMNTQKIDIEKKHRKNIRASIEQQKHKNRTY